VTRIRMLSLLVLLAAAAPAGGQQLEDYDYENLVFRGVGFEVGYLWANKVEPTPTYGVRMDLGYLGPGLRVTPSLTYWTSRMKQGEVTSLEDRLASLVARQQPPGSPFPAIELDPIDWSDLALALDAHAVWRINLRARAAEAPGEPVLGYDLLTFAGAGASVHFMNGDGAAINDTFVEDLLDSVGAGFDLHAGAEYLVSSNLRIYGMGRLELLQDIYYATLRGGVQIHLGPAAEGEERVR
jgi:hypothetical protein